MYLYETHLHTTPVSKCARKTVRENLEFYKSLGYDGVFITDHFLDGNISVDPALSYAERLDFYCSAWKEGLKIGEELGIKVFFGVELSYKGTDFLVYGLPVEWFYAHPEIEHMDKRQELQLMMDEGALVIQAHPYREAGYIDHIRLYPRSVHGVEVYNACRNDLENDMAEHYAECYELLKFAGSDNHSGDGQHKLGGMMSDFPIESEAHFVESVLDGKMQFFKKEI